MKKILIALIIGLIVGSLAVFLIFHETTPQKIESVEKTSFYEVTSHLNMGGNLYFYADTEKIARKIEQVAVKLRKFLETQTNDIQPQNLNPQQIFDFVFKLVENIGIMDVSGLGMSSIAVGENMNHTTFVVHHYPEKGKGLIWKLMQGKPHHQPEFSMLPVDTVLAGFTDFNLKVLWEWIKNEAETSNIPEIKKAILSLDPLLKSQGVELEKLLESFSGRMGMAVFLDQKNKTSVPLGNIQFEIPNPDFVFVFSTKNSYLFDLLQKILPMAHRPEEKKTKKLYIPVGSVPIPLKPVIWQRENLLFLASNESIVDSMFNTRKKGNGLAKTSEFKNLSAYMPKEGNSFRYISPRLFQLIMKIQQKAMQVSGSFEKEANAVAKEFYDLLPKELSMYAVSQNSSRGLVVTVNHNFNLEYVALLPATALAGAISAVAVPSMLTASQKAKQNATMADMKTIATAIDMYIVDKMVAPQGNSIAEIRVQLEPAYIRQLPLKDAWGNDFAYGIGKNKTDYYLGSGGRDGIFNGFDQNGMYSILNVNDFDHDIVLRNGDFVYHPNTE